MAIAMLVCGTRGDVQPFLALALGLQKDGHRVRLATHAIFKDYVESYGIEFFPMGKPLHVCNFSCAFSVAYHPPCVPWSVVGKETHYVSTPMQVETRSNCQPIW